MDIEILKPYPESIIIDGGDFELKEFTLTVITGLIKIYGNLETVESHRLSKESILFSEAITNVCWLLLEDRDYFPSICIFKNQFLPLQKGENPTKQELEKLKEFRHNEEIIDKVIERSKPISSKIDVVDHLGKKTLEKKLNKSDYGNMYVFMGTKIHSLTLEGFYNLTLRQIYKLINELQEMEHDKFIQNCRLHGISMEDEYKTSFSKKEDKNFKKHAKEMYNNLMKGFKR